MPAPATTYAEFIRRPNSVKRYLLAIIGYNPGTATTKVFYFSNIGGEVPGSSIFWHGKAKAVPAMTYNSGEFDGSEQPSFSDIVLLRENGYDISDNRSGIYVDDFGSTWIVRDREAYAWYGGDALPFSEYKYVGFGYCRGIKRTDTTVTIGFDGAANVAYRATLANTKVTAASWPNAATGDIGRIIPCCIGFVWNMRPILVDPPTNRYIFHDNSQPYTFVQVYQDGVSLVSPGQYTDNGDGTFSVTLTPTGQITCTVIGAYGFSSWATMITNMLQNYAGIPPAQIDAAAVAQANVDFPIAVGDVFEEEISVMAAIDRLSQGFPAWRGFKRTGVYSLSEIKDPSGLTATHTIDNTRSNASPIPFNDGSLSDGPDRDPIGTCNISYYRNCSPAGDDRLSNTLTLTQKSAFSRAWWEATYTNVGTIYANPTTLNKINLTHNNASAALLATKWVNLYGVERFVTVLTRPAQDLTIEKGDVVSVTFETKLRDGSSWYRHGYNTKKMLVIGMRENYTDKTQTLELWH